MSMLQVFKDVIVSEIPDSYATGALGSENFEPIDLELARRQHARYCDALRYCGCDVTVLPADERYPDCVFVEDPAVIIGSVALITKPGHATRKGETDNIRALLQSMGLVCVEITDPEAKIDGGDVQFTGKEILVGISERTNIAGVAAVREAFPGYKTLGIEVSGPLHLKTLIGLCGEDTLCVATESGDSMLMYERIREQSSVDYKAIFIPEDNVSNTILINGKVVCKSRKENPRSFEVLRRECKHELVEVETSEIEKAVGSLTCLSLRFNKPKRVGPSPMTPAVLNSSSQEMEVVASVDAKVDPIANGGEAASLAIKQRLRQQVNGVARKSAAVNGNASASSDEER